MIYPKDKADPPPSAKDDNNLGYSFSEAALKAANRRSHGSATERAKNTGISPLRRAIELRAFGRDDVCFG
jgi:hypothetical protein